jgi:nicotinate-nucleotide adenylyltransferase
VTPQRIGIYGGTFNPIHTGHLRAAEEVAEKLGLERVVFVPSGQPPHKDGQASDPIAPASLRLEWVRDAVAGNPRFEVSTLEIDRPGPSFLVDTLAELGKQLAPARPVFILGRDAFQEMGGWREPRQLLTLADLAVTTRPSNIEGTGTDTEASPKTGLSAWLPECVRSDIALSPGGFEGQHREADTRIELVEITALDLSATDVRARVRAQQSIRYLVPDAVRESIEKSGVYEAPRS